ncbi:hypothetical protein [Halegenticoccus soli]|uniref:hypothetical protein n=1 Tax=Halegenticoccus soli TaxID=1985678 RepID=UPI00117A65D8|nr:hypothetical protein [Halegenticoccus soli]
MENTDIDPDLASQIASTRRNLLALLGSAALIGIGTEETQASSSSDDATIDVETARFENILVKNNENSDQISVRGISEADNIEDVDGFTMDHGVLVEREDGRTDGHMRIMLGPEVAIGKYEPEYGGAREMLKALDGRVTLKNDAPGREVALQSQRGGGISFYTNDGGGIGSNRRRLHFDDIGKPKTNAEFLNLDTLTLEGLVKVREEASDGPQLLINPNTNQSLVTLNAPGSMRFVTGGQLDFVLSNGTIHISSKVNLRGNPLQGLREINGVSGARDLFWRELAIDTQNDRLVHSDSSGTVRYWEADGTL